MEGWNALGAEFVQYLIKAIALGATIVLGVLAGIAVNKAVNKNKDKKNDAEN